MVATTHNSLLQTAKEDGIKTKILHASSIFSAVCGASGLQIYKFGKTATITFWRKNFEPDSFVDLIVNNQKIGAHTLCLLDIDKELGAMKPSKANIDELATMARNSQFIYLRPMVRKNHEIALQNRGVALADQMVEQAMAGRTMEEWKPILDGYGLIYSPVQDATDVAGDEQAWANDFFATVEHPTRGTAKPVANPIKLSGTPSSIRTTDPERGRPTEEVRPGAG